jgi:hypothetical protein
MSGIARAPEVVRYRRTAPRSRKIGRLSERDERHFPPSPPASHHPAALDGPASADSRGASGGQRGGGVVAGAVPPVTGDEPAGDAPAGDEADGVVAATSGPAIVGREAGGMVGPV